MYPSVRVLGTCLLGTHGRVTALTDGTPLGVRPVLLRRQTKVWRRPDSMVLAEAFAGERAGVPVHLPFYVSSSLIRITLHNCSLNVGSFLTTAYILSLILNLSHGDNLLGGRGVCSLVPTQKLTTHG